MVAFQIASMRPLGATDIAPNHWYEGSPAGLLLTRIGLLQVLPSSVLRMNITSRGSGPGGSTDCSMYRFPFMAAWIDVWPSPPAGFKAGTLEGVVPPRLTIWPLNVGVCAANCALVDFANTCAD